MTKQEFFNLGGVWRDIAVAWINGVVRSGRKVTSKDLERFALDVAWAVNHPLEARAEGNVAAPPDPFVKNLLEDIDKIRKGLKAGAGCDRPDPNVEYIKQELKRMENKGPRRFAE